VGDLGPTVPGTSTVDERRRIYAASAQSARLWQGEILSDLPQSKLTLESLSATSSGPTPSDTAVAVRIEFDDHPLVIVLSQDCDLERDYKKRNTGGRPFLSNILLADVFEAERLHAQLHAEEETSSREWRKIKENLTPRFQFLNSVAADQDALAAGLSALAVDFRLYFSIRTDEVYERLKLRLTKKRCRLQTPYAEHLAHRFHAYQSRIPLAKEHTAE
jgi:hypothetical protein